jgi:hypothetical protein
LGFWWVLFDFFDFDFDFSAMGVYWWEGGRGFLLMKGGLGVL